MLHPVISGLTAKSNRFLYDALQTHALPVPRLLPTILLNIRVTLFPYNARGPVQPPPPSSSQQAVLKRKAAEAVLSLIPRPVRAVYFGVRSDGLEPDASPGDVELDPEPGMEMETEGQVVQTEALLDVLSNSYMNKHLVYNMLELILARLVPEMKERGVAELLAERGVVLAEAGKETAEGEGDESTGIGIRFGRDSTDSDR